MLCIVFLVSTANSSQFASMDESKVKVEELFMHRYVKSMNNGCSKCGCFFHSAFRVACVEPHISVLLPIAKI